MRFLGLLTFCFTLYLAGVTSADDLDVVSSLTTNEWVEVDRTRPSIKLGKHWNWRIYRHRSNGDLLTIARLDAHIPVGSAHHRDCALEFAPSGYPHFIHTNFGYSITSVKLSQTNLIVSDKARKIVKAKVPVVAYVNVNIHDDDEDDTLMLNGFSYVFAGKTYYVQHTSKRPVPVWTAEEFAEKLAIECLVADNGTADVQITP